MQTFDPVTLQGPSITFLFGLEVVISAVLLIGVLVCVGLAVTRFRAQTDDGVEPPQVHGNRALEILWTAMPAAILIVVFVLVIGTMRIVDAAPADAQPLDVIGHQWWWEYSFPNGGVITANELHVPVGVPLRINLQSVDVIHSFYVPQFGWMRDTVPGKVNQMSIQVERSGTYNGTCNQFCGLQHAWMRVVVVAEPPDVFSAWQQREQQAASPGGTRGEQVFLQNTCVSCHTIRGVSAQSNVGPDLTHLGSRATLGTGVVPNTPDALRQWIRNASAVKPGVLMPAFQNLSDADLSALVEYLESLK